MNRPILLIALILSVSVAAALQRLLMRRRPQWSERRRHLTAAFALPSLVMLTALLAIVWELVRGPGTGENMQDLAIAAIVFLAILFGLIAVAGGFLGAALGRRAK